MSSFQGWQYRSIFQDLASTLQPHPSSRSFASSILAAQSHLHCRLPAQPSSASLAIIDSREWTTLHSVYRPLLRSHLQEAILLSATLLYVLLGPFCWTSASLVLLQLTTSCPLKSPWSHYSLVEYRSLRLGRDSGRRKEHAGRSGLHQNRHRRSGKTVHQRRFGSSCAIPSGYRCLSSKLDLHLPVWTWIWSSLLQRLRHILKFESDWWIKVRYFLLGPNELKIESSFDWVCQLSGFGNILASDWSSWRIGVFALSESWCISLEHQQM